MMNVVKRKFAKLDVLVTCAGILLSPSTRVDQFEVVDWDRVIDVNLKGTFLCCTRVVQEMSKRNTGAIVNLASMAAFRYTIPPYPIPPLRRALSR